MATQKASNTKVPANFQKDKTKLPKHLEEKYTANLKALKEKQAKAVEDISPTEDSEKTTKPSAKAGPKKSTVAIFSERNVSWIGVGAISKGYNIVTAEAAKQWLTRKHVREATPEEVAAEFGV